MPRAQAPFRMTPVVFHTLLALADGEAHGYGIMKSISDRSRGRVEVGPGSLHFTLTKLRKADMIEVSSGSSAERSDARRKYFRLTAFGRQVLAAEAMVLADIVDLARARRLITESGGQG